MFCWYIWREVPACSYRLNNINFVLATLTFSPISGRVVFIQFNNSWMSWILSYKMTVSSAYPMLNQISLNLHSMVFILYSSRCWTIAETAYIHVWRRFECNIRRLLFHCFEPLHCLEYLVYAPIQVNTSSDTYPRLLI